MDQIRALKLFCRVAETGSFSRVAQEYGLGQPAVSKLISQLEAQLQLSLLQRNTRGISLTLEGQRVYEQSQSVLDAYEDLLSIGERRGPSGLIRISCPIAMGSMYILPKLKDFLAAYPDLEVELKLADSFVDLYGEGIDLALRIGHLQDSRMLVRGLGSLRRITVASKRYFRHRALPETPEDLASHHCILNAKAQDSPYWTFQKNNAPLKVRVHGNLRVDSFLSMRAAILEDLGIGLIAALLFEPRQLERDLKIVLEAYEPKPLPLSLVYPQKRHQAARVRLLIDYLHETLKAEPWLQH